MKLSIRWNEGSKQVDVPPCESDVFQEVGKILPDLSIPNTLMASCPYGEAEYTVKKRGTFTKNGIKRPSMYVSENYCTINGLRSGSYPETYLTCINEESNNYKFYHLKPRDGVIDVTYGRIGSRRGEAFGVKDIQEPYNSRRFWIRYYEKLSKGYTDQSNIYLDTEKESSTQMEEVKEEAVTKKAAPSEELYLNLLKYARQVVQESLMDEHVTTGQVKKSQELYQELLRQDTVDGFNAVLKRLMTVSPRRVRIVSTLLAVNTTDFKKIIEREEDLLHAMEAIVSHGTTAKAEGGHSFKKMGVTVRLATKHQQEEVLKRLEPDLRQKAKAVYRVIIPEQEDRYKQYKEVHNIRRVKRLWHGSRNENWLSIIKNGLLLHPNAAITGKMFGNGIYFAKSSQKSWGYTSYYGSCWASGTSGTAFMGMYETAYGRPADVYSSRNFDQKMLDAMGKNCVHAHAGQYLLNDEIIFYDESAMLLKYIVQFE